MNPVNSNDSRRTIEHMPDSASTNPPQTDTASALPPTTARQDDAGATLPPSEPPPAAIPSAGTSVPGYEILGVLGRGGMGVVYKAQHLALKRTVALKMILAGGHAGPGELARFRIEAEAVARLQHPNIVQIHEVGDAEGHPYCALEFVAGGTLAGKINGKPLPAQAASVMVESLARAMQLAHSRNVVHRDLKPANILLAADGTPKITDFGLARQLDSDSGETQAGAVMGTPSYMAPEQASGRAHEAGPAADVYALGAILYDCLAGRPPFKGNSVVETLELVRTQMPVPPSRLQASIPLDLETICLKCLRKEPENRYPSAAELADDLGRYQRGEPILARPVGRTERAVKWVKRNLVVTGAAVAVVLALTIGTTVSYLKYLDADQQKGFAEERRKEADRQTGIADEKRIDADKQKAIAFQEAERAKKARDFLVGILKISETDIRGGNITARQILAIAETRIASDFTDQPELRADLTKAIDEVKRGIGRSTPQAMILAVRGTVQVQSASGKTKPAKSQSLVNLEDRLTLSDDAEVQLVFLSDFHKERIKPGRKATVDWNNCMPSDAIQERDNSPLMTFVHIPKGTFYMSWDGRIEGVKTEIKQDFEMAAHTVTQGQWAALMGTNPSRFRRDGDGAANIKDISDEELKLLPVETVSWADAQKFIKKLNEQQRESGWSYRLPTEAEWEYACRGAATSEKECAYQFYVPNSTNYIQDHLANFNANLPPDGSSPVVEGSGPFGSSHFVQQKGKYLQRTTRVGSYPPNKLGLYDMHGNVWQWCDNLFSGSSRRPGIGRGGSWNSTAPECRVGYRYARDKLPVAVDLNNEVVFNMEDTSTQEVRRDNIGFRLVRVRSDSLPIEPAMPPVVGKPQLPRNTATAKVAGYELAINRVAAWDKPDAYTQIIGGTTVYLCLKGTALDDVKGIRTVVKDVQDNAGHALRRGGYPPKGNGPQNAFDDDGSFRQLRNLSGSTDIGDKKSQEFEQKVAYCTPSTSKSIKTLSGQIELFVPAKEPNAGIITASFANDAGKTLNNEMLKAAGVEITLQKPGPNQLTYTIKDPKNKIALMEYYDNDKKVDKNDGGAVSNFDFNDPALKTVDTYFFNTKMPANPVAKIYLVTEKSVVMVPFEFKDIPLPRR